MALKKISSLRVDVKRIPFSQKLIIVYHKMGMLKYDLVK